jgi:peroxiredoxin
MQHATFQEYYVPFRTGNKIILIAIIVIGSIIFLGCSSPEIPQSATKSSQEEPITNEVEDSPIENLPAVSEDLDLQIEPALVEEIQPEAILVSESAELTETNPEIGYGGEAEPVETEEVKSAPTPDPSLPVAPAIGAIAPNFSLTTVDGEPVSLHDLRGKSVMVNYWVTWCIPCIEEMPVLEKLHREFQDQDFVMLSVNGIAQDDLSTVMNTLGEFEVTFPVVLDEGDAVYNEFQVRFMPTSFFIDPQGVIRHIQFGSTTEDGFRSTIEELLSQQL